tara:strand:+ start:210 stop:674 length:465 start_codon:yes stop_codon:yes gene_type:complete
MYFENPEIELKELHSAIIGTLIEKNYFDNFCRKEEEQEKIREQGWWSAPAIYKKGIFRSDRNNVHPYGGELEEMGIIEIKWIEYEDTWGRKKKKKKMFRIIKSKKVKMLLFENLASIYFSRNPPTKKKTHSGGIAWSRLQHCCANFPGTLQKFL